MNSAGRTWFSLVLDQRQVGIDPISVALTHPQPSSQRWTASWAGASPSLCRLYARRRLPHGAFTRLRGSWPPTPKEAAMADLFYGALALGLFALFGAFVAALRRV
ncbi:hypothetical protein CC_1590 [Caulobacter vibrioides CB15]|uniref:Uncharacterized protein n=1 Tax=Caulobacter vibrioides (strain ATCC 19089 / CIP 103742 / CB 15) TaxID=190650 RepID=Q9A7X9_CAUVC|nr:hypothetical protein CC_1590 [Caulobacter vibrioides CB15]ATC28393.1 hypothetical protein CA607_08395 [Caulobacter vibrioides]